MSIKLNTDFNIVYNNIKEITNVDGKLSAFFHNRVVNEDNNSISGILFGSRGKLKSNIKVNKDKNEKTVVNVKVTSYACVVCTIMCTALPIIINFLCLESFDLETLIGTLIIFETLGIILNTFMTLPARLLLEHEIKDIIKEN